MFRNGVETTVLLAALGGVVVVLVFINAAFAGTELAMVSLREGQLQPLKKRSGTGGRPLAFLSRLTRPVVWLLSHSTDIAVRLMGGDPKVQREEVTEEELRDMVAVQPTFTPEQRQIIDGAFEIAERTLVPIHDLSDIGVELPDGGPAPRRCVAHRLRRTRWRPTAPGSMTSQCHPQLIADGPWPPCLS